MSVTDRITAQQERDRQLVHEAASWLDEQHPGWAGQINLEALHMGSPRQCIAGQCGLAWIEVGHQFAESASRDRFEGEFAFASCEDHWRDEVGRRT